MTTPLPPPVPVDEILALLKLKVIEATDLPTMDLLGGGADPFFRVIFGTNQVKQSQVVMGTQNPKWEEEQPSKVLISKSEKLYPLNVKIYNWQSLIPNVLIGSVDLDVPNLLARKIDQNLVLPILNSKGEKCGMLHIHVTPMNQNDVERDFWDSYARHFDSDGNGHLNKTEFAVMVGAVHSHATNEEIDAMFQSCKLDANNEIFFQQAVDLLSGDEKELERKWLAYDPQFLWHAYCRADEFNDVATIVLNKDLLPTTIASPSKGVLVVLNRETGKLEEERIPQYIEASMRAMYSRIGRTLVEISQIKRLLNHLSVAQGNKYNDPRSKQEIQRFIDFHHLNVDEIQNPIASFKNFNEFFYRKLKPNARVIAEPNNPKVVVSGADCRLNVFSTVVDATTFWIKGTHFSILNLLQNEELAKKFTNGSVMIARLAPQDYHRFHFPIDCTVGKTENYDGTLYTVNPIAITQNIDVYTENKRACTILESPIFGTVAYVAIGATMVGSITITSHEGQHAKKGDEHGYFSFGGSTVIVLFEPGKIIFDADLLVNSRKPVETLVKMGSRVGILQ